MNLFKFYLFLYSFNYLFNFNYVDIYLYIANNFYNFILNL